MVETYFACTSKGIDMGIVSGSDYTKVKSQLGLEIIQKSKYCFCENGLHAFKYGKQFEKKSIKDHLSEDNL